jgi:hypothetical protein
MKTVLAISLTALALLGGPAAALATETDAAATETPVVPDGEPAPPHADGEQADAPDHAAPDDDMMKNFTRHRPGACPEGPPCKIED